MENPTIVFHVIDFSEDEKGDVVHTCNDKQDAMDFMENYAEILQDPPPVVDELGNEYQPEGVKNIDLRLSKEIGVMMPINRVMYAPHRLRARNGSNPTAA